jgi:hypothetical protein
MRARPGSSACAVAFWNLATRSFFPQAVGQQLQRLRQLLKRADVVELGLGVQVMQALDERARIGHGRRR